MRPEAVSPEATVPAATQASPFGRVLPLLVVLLAVVFLAVRINRGVYLGDEGVAAMSGWRIARGQIPNVDFFQIIPPLSLDAVALAFRVIGPTVVAERLVALLYGLILILLMWVLGRAYLRNPWPRAAALAFLIPFGVGAWPIPSHHWAADLCLLGALAALQRGLARDSAAWMAAGGGAVAAGVLCLQDQGAYAVLAVALMVPCTVPSGERWRFARAWLLGLVGFGATVSLVVWRGLPLQDLFEDLVVFPLTRYGQAQGSMWTAAAGWHEVFGSLTWGRLHAAPFFLPLVVLAYGLLFLLPFLAALGAWPVWREGRPSRAQATLLLAIALAFLGGAAHRWALMNLTWASPGLALVAAASWDALWNHRRSWLRRLGRGLAVGSTVVLCAFGAAGTILVARTPGYPVSSAAGILHAADVVQAAALQPFLDAIEADVPPGAPAFSWGYIPLVNFLTGHPNPTRYDVMVSSPPYNGPDQQREWIRELEAKNVEWGFSHRFPIQEGDLAARYVREHYEPAWTNGAFTLWRRKP